MNGAAAALFVSTLPFQGPIASVRIGRVDGELIAFPTHNDLEESDMDLIVSGSEAAVLMIEGFAREVPEDGVVIPLEEGQRPVVDPYRWLLMKVTSEAP